MTSNATHDSLSTHKKLSESKPVLTPPTPPIWDLGDIPGIDGADAARRFFGNAAKYRKLLTVFIEQFGGVMKTLETEIQTGNTTNAIAVLHTLRGAAGNLSMTRVAAVARESEVALRDHGEVFPGTLLSELDAAIIDLIEKIAALAL